jgi:hypothetical protein
MEAGFGSCCTSKVTVFAWKVIRNGLPTNANKNYRHIAQDSCCELCGFPTEDCFHAVITCPHAVALRYELRKQVALPAKDDLKNVGPEWLLMLLRRYDADTNLNFLMLIWRCWNLRNSVIQIQAGEGISIKGSVRFLTRDIESLLQIRQQANADDGRGK